MDKFQGTVKENGEKKKIEWRTGELIQHSTTACAEKKWG